MMFEIITLVTASDALPAPEVFSWVLCLLKKQMRHQSESGAPVRKWSTSQKVEHQSESGAPVRKWRAGEELVVFDYSTWQE